MKYINMFLSILTFLFKFSSLLATRVSELVSLNSNTLLLMRAMMVHKCDVVAPHSFEDGIDQVLLVRTVVPVAQIERAVRVLARRFHLDVVDTPFAFEPEELMEFLDLKQVLKLD